MGMAEQLLMGAAAGMAHEGAQPFVTTYAVFATRRAYDFMHQTIAEDNLDVKIVCALPGLTTGYGPSHQAAEDLALMRAMPNMTVIDPCDALDIEQMVPAIAAHNGPVYARLLRGNVPAVLDEYDYKFELGKAKMLRDGAEVLIISSGIMTMRSLEVAKALEADKVGVACAARADHQAARYRDDPARSEAHGTDGRGRGESYGDRWSGRSGRDDAAARRASCRCIARSRCPMRFSLRARCRRLHDRYGISTNVMAETIKGWLG